MGSSGGRQVITLPLNIASGGTGAITATAARTSALPTEGMVVYNTITSVLNFHNGTSWGAV